jgi:hypothetical protein
MSPHFPELAPQICSRLWSCSAANFGSVNHTFKGQAYSGTTVVNPGPPPTYDYSTDSYNHDLTFQAVRGALSFKC